MCVTYTQITGHFSVSCAHGELEPRLWLLSGSKTHKELELIVNSKQLCKDIKQLAHLGQTSALQSFHKIVTFFAPKNFYYFYSAMEAQILLAALHFNENSPQNLDRRLLQNSVSCNGLCLFQWQEKVKQLLNRSLTIQPTFSTSFPHTNQHQKILAQTTAEPKPVAMSLSRPDKENAALLHTKKQPVYLAGACGVIQVYDIRSFNIRQNGVIRTNIAL